MTQKFILQQNSFRRTYKANCQSINQSQQELLFSSPTQTFRANYQLINQSMKFIFQHTVLIVVTHTNLQSKSPINQPQQEVYTEQ